MASALRLEVPRARPGFRVSNIRTQTALIEQHTGRERLLSILALFFGVVALSLAGVGLYGVLDYSVLQRRREIGIRIAIGAQATDIARRVIMDVFAVVLAGSLFGIVLGIASVRKLSCRELQDYQCDVVGLRSALGERRNRLLNRHRESRRRIRPRGLPPPPAGVFLPKKPCLQILRLGHAVAVDHDLVARPPAAAP